MKRVFPGLLVIASYFAFAQHQLKLWYKQTAKEWTEALPLGNGKRGVMGVKGIVATAKHTDYGYVNSFMPPRGQLIK